MTYSQEQQKKFWKMYDEFLLENGEPFTISNRRHWCVVNAKNENESCLGMDFLAKKKILRVGIYIRSDINNLYQRLLNDRENLDSGFEDRKPEWCEKCKGENTRRIKIEIPFANDSVDEYERIIELSAKYTLKFIKAYRPYIEV